MGKKVTVGIFLLYFIACFQAYATPGWEDAHPVSQITPGIYAHNPVITTGEDILGMIWEEKKNSGNI
jgi:hypothetical protein